jgi:hypothetical protein
MQTHTLAGKHLKVTTLIHFMSTKKLIHFDWEVHQHTQNILNECLVFPIQRNCYHLSSERQLSGRPETVKYHENLGRTFITARLCGRKQYTFSSWNWTHTVRATQGCSTKLLQGFNLISTNQWMANRTRNITHTQHTQSDDILTVF